jgi:hypothetical protein
MSNQIDIVSFHVLALMMLMMMMMMVDVNYVNRRKKALQFK